MSNKVWKRIFNIWMLKLKSNSRLKEIKFYVYYIDNYYHDDELRMKD